MVELITEPKILRKIAANKLTEILKLVQELPAVADMDLSGRDSVNYMLDMKTLEYCTRFMRELLKD